MKWRNEGFEGKKRRGRLKVLNKAAKVVLKRALCNTGDSTRKLSHSLQVQSRTGHEKLFKMFKIRGPLDGKKRSLCSVCQVTPSPSQICKEVQTPC